MMGDEAATLGRFEDSRFAGSRFAGFAGSRFAGSRHLGPSDPRTDGDTEQKLAGSARDDV